LNSSSKYDFIIPGHILKTGGHSSS